MIDGGRGGHNVGHHNLGLTIDMFVYFEVEYDRLRFRDLRVKTKVEGFYQWVVCFADHLIAHSSGQNLLLFVIPCVTFSKLSKK